MAEFNCCKMKHIFLTEGAARAAPERREAGGREVDADDAASYLLEWSCQEAKEAMHAIRTGEAKVYIKIDGSCGALVREADGSYTIYQRFDDKKNKFKNGTEIPEGYIAAPGGGNLGLYNGGGATHRYFLKKLSRKPEAKFEKKIADPLYKIVDAAVEGKRVPDKDFVSVELVGENFNRTPGVVGNGIAVHSQQEFPWHIDPMDIPVQWLTWLKNHFAPGEGFVPVKVIYEGLIVEHMGRCWKIRSDKLWQGTPKAYEPPVVL